MASLYETLKHVKSEEDVKDAYIHALGLKKYTKGLVDIRTKEIWFEAKDSGSTSSYKMFTQLLHYVQDGLNKGEELPPFLAVIDTEKAALMKTAAVVPFLKKKTIKWGKSATQFSKDALDQVSAYIGAHMVSFKISTHEDEFKSTVKAAIKSGDIIRTPITPDNLKQVFDKWVEVIGREISGAPEDKYALLFFADVMHDGTVATHENLPAELLHQNNSPVFSLEGKIYKLTSKEGYRQFWAIYHRPPDKAYRDYLLERRDSLIPVNDRMFRGAFYTPLQVVDKAYDKLAELLGKNWQKNYLVWDMCCGVGNLEVKHSNPRNIFMSTLDQADVDVMCATKTCVAAERFQYNYLVDDITNDGRIDYALTNKVPEALKKAIKDGKKILVLINPPYAEAASSQGNEGKTDVARNKVATLMQNDDIGYAARELFAQFLVRVSKEIPNATLAMFSKLKYVNAPNFEQFREYWSAKFLGGFIVHSKAFDGLKGNFPIGFLIWKTEQKSIPKTHITEIECEVLDRNAMPIGDKTFYHLPNSTFLSEWMPRTKKNDVDAIPLINAVTPIPKTLGVRNVKWADNAIGHFFCNGNDLQNSGTMTAIFSSVHSIGHAGGYFINEQNLWQVAVVFSVRRLIKPTWINDRDQFLKPEKKLTDAFKNDCLIWMLFNGSNLTAGADKLNWNKRNWKIVNYFVPFNEAEVGASERFESDFMVKHLKGKTQSTEAKAVLNAGRVLWKAYFSASDVYTIREELKLNRPDVGWYQIRNALKRREVNRDQIEVDFLTFDVAYKCLSDKLVPQVYDLGFLRE